MALLVVGTEKNFAALRPRLLTGSISTKQAGAISAEIQAANPHVDLQNLQEGTVLEIPDHLPHVEVLELSLGPAAQQAATRLVEVGSSVLAGLAAAGQIADTTASASRKTAARALATKGVTDTAKKDQALAASVQAAKAALAAADKAAAARQAAFAQAAQSWDAELQALKATLPS
jgi:hypothetical protein